MSSNIVQHNHSCQLHPNSLLRSTRYDHSYHNPYPANSRKNRRNVKFLGSSSPVRNHEMSLDNMDLEPSLIKSRVRQQDNFEQYPYGRQNIEIQEEILDRYKKTSDYLNQSRIIEKFRIEAKQSRQLVKSRKLAQNKQLQEMTNGFKLANENRNKKLQRQSKYFRILREQEKRSREIEQQKMDNIAKQLKKLAKQLQNNSYVLENGIKELSSRLKPKKIYQNIPISDTLDFQLRKDRVPTIVYHDRQSQNQFTHNSDYSLAHQTNRKVVYQNQDFSQRNKCDKIIQSKRNNAKRLNDLSNYYL